MKRLFSFIMVCFLVVNVFATENIDISSASFETARYLYGTVQKPTVASVGGEWTVIGLAQSGADIPDEYFERYYKNVEEYIKNKKGILHSRKYTEYSRVVLALTAIGKDPRNVAGYDLLLPLGDYKKTVQQGVNGAAWALIALDCGNYELPQNPLAEIQATREMYIEHILSRQNRDGGWSLGDIVSDVDITAMCLRALAKYRVRQDITLSCNRGVTFLSKAQDENGSFSSWNVQNSESVMQTIIALCALGISLDDPRFVKGGRTLISALRSYMSENGAFLHTQQGNENLMATEQALLCFNAMRSAEKKKLARGLVIPLINNPLSMTQISRDCPRLARAFLNLTNAR
ncbi:MAG: terpene cyclase/mutase family protein [Oscillospiraceae bacterium]|nr:terpene cyclase/mutase family protein [Oscillospiraceae bacterium]